MRVSFSSFESNFDFGDGLQLKLTRRMDENNQELASMEFFKNGEEAEFKLQKIPVANLLAFTSEGTKPTNEELVIIASSCFLQILDVPVAALQEFLARARHEMSDENDSDSEDSMETQVDGSGSEEEIDVTEEVKALLKEIFKPVLKDVKEFQTLLLHFFAQSFRRM